MNREQAQQIRQGDEVTFGGHVYTVESVAVRGMEAPYFRIQGDGLVSYRLCGRVTRNAGQYIEEVSA